jgi:hypothetical protein
MKATIEFQLPEEQEEFMQAAKAGTMRNLMWDWDQFLRQQSKYGYVQATTWDQVRQEWFERLREFEIDLTSV